MKNNILGGSWDTGFPMKKDRNPMEDTLYCVIFETQCLVE